jgi:hypothetical protein
MVAMPVSFRMRSEKGVWNMRPYTGRARIEVCPAETLMMSTPASPSRRAILTASSGVTPSSPTQSLAEIRTEIGFGDGQTARTAW